MSDFCLEDANGVGIDLRSRVGNCAEGLKSSSDTRSDRGRLLQALTSDSAARIDGASYRRYRLQELVRSPETLCRIFLKEFLKENDNRLGDIFELLKR